MLMTLWILSSYLQVSYRGTRITKQLSCYGLDGIIIKLPIINKQNKSALYQYCGPVEKQNVAIPQSWLLHRTKFSDSSLAFRLFFCHSHFTFLSSLQAVSVFQFNLIFVVFYGREFCNARIFRKHTALTKQIYKIPPKHTQLAHDYCTIRHVTDNNYLQSQTRVIALTLQYLFTVYPKKKSHKAIRNHTNSLRR